MAADIEGTSMSVAESGQLSEKEKDQIRKEIRYALTVLQEERSGSKSKTFTDKLLGVLSNGFILLVVGSIVTYFLVPHFQRQYEDRKQQVALMRDCLTEFLLYTNSIWEEYHTLIPLVEVSNLNRSEYNAYLKNLSDVRLKRYNAFARVEALTTAFRELGSQEESDVEKAVTDYAGQSQEISKEMRSWLLNVYCLYNDCASTPDAPVHKDFHPHTAFVKLGNRINDLVQEERLVAQLMVSRIKSVK
jgi:hypothetical protein